MSWDAAGLPPPPPVAAPVVPPGITFFVKTISGRKQSLGPVDPHTTTTLHVKHMLRELEVGSRQIVIFVILRR